MSNLFYASKFNRNISQWDVSEVKNMMFMFAHSEFNNEINQWNVSSVESMEGMFQGSLFNQDISEWQPIALKNKENMFQSSKLEQADNLPYWANIDLKFLPKTIGFYQLNKKLNTELKQKNKSNSINLKI